MQDLIPGGTLSNFWSSEKVVILDKSKNRVQTKYSIPSRVKVSSVAPVKIDGFLEKV